MPPRSELNERFQSYQKSSHRLRTFGTVLLSSGLVVGSAFAFEVVAPPKSEARAHIEQSLAQATAAFSSVVHSINNAFYSFGTTRPISYARIGNGSQSAAAAATISTTHSIGTSTSTTTPKNSKPATPTLPAPKASASQTIVRNIYIPASQSNSVNPIDLLNLKSSIETEFNARFASITNPPPFPQQIGGGGTTVIYQSSPSPASQRIDQLQNTSIANPSITGGSISNASIGATTLSAGATTLGATNATSLNVSGASVLSGDLTIGGTLTANTLTVASVTSGGAVAAPYFSATNTAATSTFSGGVLGAFTHFTSGLIDTLTTSVANIVGFTATNSTTTNATSTNSYSTNLAAAAARFGSTATSTFDSAGNLAVAGNESITGNTTLAGATSTAFFSPIAAFSLARFGATATSTFAANGALTTPAITVTGTSQFNNSSNFIGLTSFGATATTTIATNGTISTPSIVASNGGTFYGSTSFGSTATSSFGTNGALTLVSNGLSVGGNQLVVSGGNVGIGTTSPAYALHVSGATPRVQITATSSTASTQFLIANDVGQTAEFDMLGSAYSFHGGSALIYTPDLRIFADGNAGGGAINFYTNASGAWVDTPKVTFSNTGNVGIGTTTPGTLLSLGNTGNSTINISATATSTFGTGLNLRTGCFAIGGTCLTTGSLGLTGTQGQVAYFSGTNTAVGTSSLFIATSGNVGIGTASPDNNLKVAFSAPDNTHGITIENNQTAGFGGSLSFHHLGTGDWTSRIQVSNTNSAPVNGIMSFIQPIAGSDAQTAMTLRGANLGIGLTSPTYKLDVSGLGHFTGLVDAANFVATSTATSTFSAIGSASGNLTIGSAGTTNNILLNPYGGNVGIGTASPAAKLELRTSSGDGIAIYNTDGASSGLYIASGPAYGIYSTASKNYFSGNVGVGTTSPASKFTVVGAGCFSQGPGSATIACGPNAGDIYYNNAHTGAYDLAEDYVTSDMSVATGTIVALDTSKPRTIKTASRGSTVLGVVSTQPGVELGSADAALQGQAVRPVALAGRVPVRVNMEGGAIAIGDGISLSPTPGVGMRASGDGETIGIALTAITSDGMVDVFVHPAYAFSPTTLTTVAALSSIGSTASTTGSTTSNFLDALFIFSQIQPHRLARRCTKRHRGSLRQKYLRDQRTV